jgi:hypothetical protein
VRGVNTVKRHQKQTAKQEAGSSPRRRRSIYRDPGDCRPQNGKSPRG